MTTFFPCVLAVEGILKAAKYVFFRHEGFSACPIFGVFFDGNFPKSHQQKQMFLNVAPDFSRNTLDVFFFKRDQVARCNVVLNISRRRGVAMMMMMMMMMLFAEIY